MQYFKDKTILVTGAASGIGRALAETLAASGARVYAADINIVPAEVGGSGKDGDTLESRRLDVTKAGEFQNLVNQIARETGRLDYLFNNAGIGVAGEAHELPLPAWTACLDVNLRGAVHGILAAYPLMVRQGGGHIVNIASLSGLVPVGLMAAYSMTKHGLVGLSNSLRLEARASGVRVSVVCPAAVETPMLDAQPPTGVGADFWMPNIRRYLTALAGPPYPVDRLIADILRGVQKNRGVIVAPARGRAVWRLARWFPGLVELVSARAVTRERAAAGRGR
jgi:NAD(P)-dependent dehydrogenase (short-subunit alcohol dehydrogenase family)